MQINPSTDPTSSTGSPTLLANAGTGRLVALERPDGYAEGSKIVRLFWDERTGKTWADPS